ncbi:MAG TPA: rod shape-determining protein MreD [Gemmatimonadota bacterium]|nr:rod shape-determining protein MreD [Gemmatimonadota bacterium]
MIERPTRPGPERTPTGRFLLFLVACLAAAMLLEDPLSLGGAAPDFTVIALVYGAIRWGALRGAVLGFGLGIFLDTLVLFQFGLHALGMTAIGYVLGKLRETVYLTTGGVDLPLLAGAKLALDVLVLAVAAGGAWAAFELRFFWDSPLSALYTTLVGALGHRVFLGS